MRCTGQSWLRRRPLRARADGEPQLRRKDSQDLPILGVPRPTTPVEGPAVTVVDPSAEDRPRIHTVDLANKCLGHLRVWCDETPSIGGTSSGGNRLFGPDEEITVAQVRQHAVVRATDVGDRSDRMMLVRRTHKLRLQVFCLHTARRPPSHRIAQGLIRRSCHRPPRRSFLPPLRCDHQGTRSGVAIPHPHPHLLQCLRSPVREHARSSTSSRTRPRPSTSPNRGRYARTPTSPSPKPSTTPNAPSPRPPTLSVDTPPSAPSSPPTVVAAHHDYLT